MTEIIPGLQGDIPANHSKGVPYVSGRLEPLCIYRVFSSWNEIDKEQSSYF